MDLQTQSHGTNDLWDLVIEFFICSDKNKLAFPKYQEDKMQNSNKNAVSIGELAANFTLLAWDDKIKENLVNTSKPTRLRS
jgi:hypothetical protein